jgi:hypothetical protein
LGTTSAANINDDGRLACGPRVCDIIGQTRPPAASGADGTAMGSALGINMAP